MRIALAALSGILLAVAFPEFNLSLVSFIALFPLLFALHVPGRPLTEVVPPRTAFRLGYVTGAFFFLVILYWIPFLPRENVTIPYFMYPALLIMVAYLSLFPALTALGTALLARRGVAVGVSFPLLWTLFEFIRGTGILGFPWGTLGYAFAFSPHLVQFAEYTGLWGVSLWVSGINGMVHVYLCSRWVAPKMAALIGLVALLVFPYMHGRSVLSRRLPRGGVEVGIVQPNVGKDKWKAAVRDSVVNAILGHTELLAREEAEDPPRLILWPETAIPARVPRDLYYRRRVETLVDTLGIPVLVGYPDGVRLPDGDVRFTNSAGLVLPGLGIVHQYDKRHLVPFSEMFPLPILNRFDFGQANFSAGTEPGIMVGVEPRFGVLICFESIFPGPARELARLGARYLVNITNDQWFGDSAAPVQHFAMNVLRCIENRMGMVRAANTGISGTIDPYGFVTTRTPTFEVVRAVMAVELGDAPTVYTRYGDWILWLAGGALIGAAGWGEWKRRWG